MTISVKTVADKVFNLLKGYGYTVDSFDKEGMQVGDPADAIRFFVESPNLLITLNVPTDEIQLSVSENTEETDTLRKQLNNLARDYLMALDFRVFGKTLKPSSEAVSIAKQKEKDMMEQNILRKLAGLPEQQIEVQEGYPFQDQDLLDPEHQPDHSNHSRTLSGFTQFFVSKINQFMDYKKVSVADIDELVHELNTQPGFDYLVQGWNHYALGKEKSYDPMDPKLFKAFIEKIIKGQPDIRHDLSNTLTIKGNDVIAHHVRDESGKRYDPTEDQRSTKYDEVKGGRPGLNKPNTEESVQVAESFGTMSGSMKTSYQPLDNVKIIVKHAKAVNEEVRGSRSRNISKIFIQRGEERFAFPSKNLSGARAMARHIHNGGEMHDSIGESIVKMCKDISTLKEFVRYVRSNDLVNESNQEYVTLAMENIGEIKNTFKKLSGVKTYAKAVESIADQQNIEIIQEVDLEDHFTETHFDDKVANAVDTIKFLVNRKNTFENYIMKTIELEEFKGVKSLISESDTLEFDTPNAKLGFQVSQLSSAVKDSTLANYLDSIGSKLNAGGTLNPFEYRAVKASLLSAGNKRAVYAEHFVEEEYYQKFIESFIPEDK